MDRRELLWDNKKILDFCRSFITEEKKTPDPCKEFCKKLLEKFYISKGACPVFRKHVNIIMSVRGYEIE